MNPVKFLYIFQRRALKLVVGRLLYSLALVSKSHFNFELTLCGII
jgi:hypothetical protein